MIRVVRGLKRQVLRATFSSQCRLWKRSPQLQVPTAYRPEFQQRSLSCFERRLGATPRLNRRNAYQTGWRSQNEDRTSDHRLVGCPTISAGEFLPIVNGGCTEAVRP